jgi:non-heme chloroperoxidase
MLRRNLLKSIATIAASTGLVAASKANGQNGGSLLTAARKKPRAKQFLEAADGTNLFFRDRGTGRPMVFVAPWALNSAWWQYQMADLAGRGLRCVAYDRRGHGRSGDPSYGYEFDTLADDLATMIEQIDLHDTTLVGHSMGCGEVVRYLSRHGSSRVARVVLVGTITPFILKTDDNPEGADRATLENARKGLSKDLPNLLAAYAPTFFGSPKNHVSQEIMDWWVRMMVDGCSLKTMLDLHRMFTETDFRPELPRIAVPTLLIHGDNDKSTPIETTARKTAPLIPGSQLKVYEGAGHGLPITHADQLNADLLDFAKG